MKMFNKCTKISQCLAMWYTSIHLDMYISVKQQARERRITEQLGEKNVSKESTAMVLIIHFAKQKTTGIKDSFEISK